jgi:uncharacterized iron-regulated protein
MTHPLIGSRIATCLLLLVAVGAAKAAPIEIEPNSTALMQAMQGHRVVLLGEVHDNAAQHGLRAAALRELLANGARPAIAFEQFDQERQRDIERARRQRTKDADYLIAQAGGNSAWNWDYYRPFVALALEYDLPIVAANLSRNGAMRVALHGWSVLFDARTRKRLGLDALPSDLRRKQEEAIAAGHCYLLPAKMVKAQARAQMARDITIAQSIRPYVDRGVVLLAGNGHVRRDIGVPFWLAADAARDAVSIGMLERDDGSGSETTAPFDVYVITEPATRTDPCKELTLHAHRVPQPR